MQLLLEAEVRQLTLGALQQFNLDVEECERKMQNHLICVSVSWFEPGGQLSTTQLLAPPSAGKEEMTQKAQEWR